MKISKIAFKIEDFDGSDPDHTPQELLIHTPFATGWQSERFCPFPQHLTLRLTEGFHRIFKIQILLHHYKIPTRLELLVSKTGKIGEYEKLGYVSIDDNSKNNFKARELKTIHVDVKTNLIRINCSKCHVNPLNLYNQIGIVAINILGAPIDGSEVANSPADIANAITRGIIERSFADENTPIDSDLSFIDHDRLVVHALASIATMKKEAVKNENYPLAKSLKKLQEEFNTISAEISAMLAEKRSCLTVEDYDKAQSLQAQIQTKKHSITQRLYESGYELKEEGLILKNSSLAPLSPSQQNMQISPEKEFVSLKSESNQNPLDAPIKTKYVEQIQSESRPTSARSSDGPRPLSIEEQKEFALCISIFGKHIVACVLSPVFNHREEGMKLAEVVLKDTEVKRDEDEVVKATFQILSLVAPDARERSHAQMITLFYAFIDYCQINRYPASAFVSLLAHTFPLLLNKAADMNPRIKKRTTDLITRLCELYHSPDGSALPLVISPFVTTKIQSIPWKNIKARLDIAVDLIQIHGLQDGKPSHPNGWYSKDIIDFSLPFITHTNQEVRDGVALLLAHVAILVPNMLKSLHDIPPAAIESIQKKITAIGGNKISYPSISLADEQQSEEEFEKKCIFCGLSDGNFTPESLDTHYWKECPVLVQCGDCNTLVEVSDYTTHKLLDCDLAEDNQECSKCGMAIKKLEKKEHLASSTCKAKMKSMDRCPLCFEDCKGGIQTHLLNAPGCSASDRKALHPTKSAKKGLFGF